MSRKSTHFHLIAYASDPPPDWEKKVTQRLQKELGFTLGEANFTLTPMIVNDPPPSLYQRFMNWWWR